MRPARTGAALLAAVVATTHGAACGCVDVVQVFADDVQALQASLLALTQERLQAAGVSVADERAWLKLSTELPAAGTFDVRPLWSAEAVNASLPLQFELRPVRAANTPWIRATLAVGLQREVLVAARRLRKGSTVGCSDLVARRRNIRDLPQTRLAVPCAIDSQEVALRDIATGDLVRTSDVGQPPAVSAGRPVSVSVVANGVSVTTTAIALADASIGDQIDVRLQRPTRTLRTRVTGPGTVQLMEPQ